MHLTQQNENCYHIFLDESLIGWVKVLERDDLPLLDCFLEEPYRGQGHGTQACNQVLERLEEEHSLVLACCEVGNSAAMRLCSRLGFELRSLRGEEMWFEARL